jgi:hypothetical protein
MVAMIMLLKFELLHRSSTIYTLQLVSLCVATFIMDITYMISVKISLWKRKNSNIYS